MIYILEDTDRLDEAFVTASMPLLSRQRQEKMQEYALLSDRINSCAVYLLLREGLRREYGMETKPSFVLRERGKPYLEDCDGIFFNFSHCRNTAVCILADTDTAIDVMELRTVRSAVIKRTCSPQERYRLSQSSFPERDFIKLWTRKECWAKLNGQGMQWDFCEVVDTLPEMRDIHTVDFGKYILSYYSHGTARMVKIHTDELLKGRM